MGEPLLKEEKLTGCYITKEQSDQLALVAHFYNTSRSEIIRKMILDRLANDLQPAAMVKELASRLVKAWREQFTSKVRGRRMLPFEDFVKKMDVGMARKNINREYIDAIIKRAQKIHENQVAERHTFLRRTK